MYTTLSKLKKAIKQDDLEEVSNNLYRYHTINNDKRNDFWRVSTFTIGAAEVMVEYYLGKFKGITVTNKGLKELEEMTDVIRIV